MAIMGPFGLIPEEDDWLEEALEDLRFRTEHPEEWEKKEHRKKEAAEIARKKVEDSKNIPQDYFDGWDTCMVQKGESINMIAQKLIREGRSKKGPFTLVEEIIRDNERQLPFKGNSIYPGMKLRIRRKEQDNE